MDKPSNLKLGERRIVTVLFADMKDFTSISEHMDPEEMDNLMSGIFSGFESVVKNYGGEVEKYIGDALVAVFGYPIIHEDDAARACNAALDFLEEVRKTNEGLAERESRIDFRIGINTGLITTGKRGDFEVVTGNTMNMASRLQDNAAPGQILVSQSTKEKCEAEFIYGEEKQLKVKGAALTLGAFSLEGRNPDPFKDSSAFVGRVELLDKMLKAYLRHQGGETEGFLVSGEPGIGKTRLAAGLIAKIRRFPDFNTAILYARAKRYQPLKFALITEILIHYFEINLEEEASRTADRISKRIDLERKTALEFAYFIKGESDSRLDNQAFVLLYLILKCIIDLYQNSPYPVLLFIDDANNIDSQSRDFFAFFLKNASEKPFFFVCDRKTDSKAAEVFEDLKHIRLEPLDNQESKSLMQKLWPELKDKKIIDTILENAFGNPLFIREYVNYAREAKDVSSLPTTIQNIFLSSISSHDTEMQELLKKLSVFRQNFSRADAAYIHEKTEGNPGMVESALSFYLREGVLTEENGLCFFRHDVFKKALYNSLLNYNKRILHRLIARRMQEVGKPNIPRLLYHFSRGEDLEGLKEIILSKQYLSSINPEYLPYIDILLGSIGDEEKMTLLKLLFLKSAIHFNNGNTLEADSVVREIIRMAVVEKDSAFAASAYHILSARNAKTYSFQKVSFFARKAVSLYQETGEEAGAIANTLKIHASSELLRGRKEEAWKLIEEIRKVEDVPRIALLNAEAEFHFLTGDYAAASDSLEEAAKEENRNGENDECVELSQTYFLLGKLKWALCDFEGLIETVRKLQQEFTISNNQHAQCYAHLAASAEKLGEKSLVDKSLKQAEFLLSQVRNDYDCLDVQRSLALAYYMIGNIDKAEDLATEGISNGLRHAGYYPSFTLLILLTEIAFLKDRRESAAFFLKESDFLYNTGVLLPRQDLILYYWYRYILIGEDEGEGFQQKASEALENELAKIQKTERKRRFLRLRSFQKVDASISAAILTG